MRASFTCCIVPGSRQSRSTAQAADEIGRSRASVSNLLRLLDLPEPIKQLLQQHKLDMGHARALLTLDPKLALGLARQAAEHGWSVRELEDAARKGQTTPKATTSAPRASRSSRARR